MTSLTLSSARQALTSLRSKWQVRASSSRCLRPSGGGVGWEFREGGERGDPLRWRGIQTRFPEATGLFATENYFRYFLVYIFVNWNCIQDEGHPPRDWRTEQACFPDDLPPTRFPWPATWERTLCYFTSITFSYMQAKDWCSLWCAQLFYLTVVGKISGA